MSYGDRYIDVLIHETPQSVMWRDTFMYGEPKSEDMHLMWELLRRIKPRSQAPWLMIGDFNEAIWQFEHFSRTHRSESERLMLDFREVLSHCDLHDLGFARTPWPYDNKQVGERNVKVRLDRAAACPAWSAGFPEAKLSHIASSTSNHCQLLVQLVSSMKHKTGRKCLRYEIMWEREESLAEEIRRVWDCGRVITDLGDIAAPLKSMMGSLHGWSKEKFGSITRE